MQMRPPSRVLLLCALAAVFQFARSTTGPPRGVTINGELFPTADIEAGKVEIEKGTFIVGVAEGTKDTVLGDIKKDLSWEPTIRFSDGMPMFAGELEKSQMVWLLKRAEVEYIENDGMVKALRKTPRRVAGAAAMAAVSTAPANSTLAGASPRTGRVARATSAGEHVHSLLGLSHLGKSPTWSFAGKPQGDRELDCPGPGAYSLSPPEVTSRFGKGPHFTFGTSGREVLSKHKMPGPGSYSLSRDFGKSGGPAYSLSPRGRPLTQPPKEIQPGPGAHDLGVRFPEGPKFTVSPRRVDGNRGTGPGPGDYDVAVTEATAERQPRCCFGTASHTAASGTAITPGPGAYSPPAAIGEGPKFSMKGRFLDHKPHITPGPGAHGGHWSTMGDYRPSAGPAAPNTASPRQVGSRGSRGGGALGDAN